MEKYMRARSPGLSVQVSKTPATEATAHRFHGIIVASNNCELLNFGGGNPVLWAWPHREMLLELNRSLRGRPGGSS